MRRMAMAVLTMALVGCGSAHVSAQQVVEVEPGGSGAGWIDGSPVRSRIIVGADGEMYVGVWIDAPADPRAHRGRAPMAVSLVVDTSGSMAGDKIQNARMAAASLLESLTDGDVVSIYAFNNAVSEIAPPTVVSAGSRSMLMQRVNQLYAAGGTNLYGGMQAGVQRMAQAPPGHPLRRIFVISDGRANVGPSDPASLGNLAAQATEFGTQVTAIGVGYDYDQHTLQAMAVQSSGRLYHLSQPQQMASILEQELDLLGNSVAVNAVLEVVPAPGVTILEGATTGATVVNGHLRMPLGALHAGQHREVLFRARVDTNRPGSRPLAEARLAYQSPTDDARAVQRAAIQYEVTRDRAAAARSEAPPVVAMVANHRATQAQLRAAELMRQGQGRAAADALGEAHEELRTAAASAPAAPQSQALRRRAADMSRARDRASRARTRSEMQQGAYEFADEAMEAEGF